MKLSLHRTLIIVAVIDIAALVLSGVPRFKNARHGLAAAVGTGAWICFLAGLLALAVLAVVAIARSLRGRRSLSTR